MAKRPVPLYDFKAFGAAIKATRKEHGESRKKVSDELYISPRYLANIDSDIYVDMRDIWVIDPGSSHHYLYHDHRDSR